jgi:hypothetical protein
MERKPAGAWASRFQRHRREDRNARQLAISRTKSVSYAIVGVGGFLGVARHDVALSVDQFSDEGGKLVLAGASREALKSMPPFEYAQ